MTKPQYVDQIPKLVNGVVQELLDRKDDKGNQEEILDILDLTHLTERKVSDLSGGELQRFAIAMVCIQKAHIYMFDEPSSYLDVKQRLNAAIMIRDLLDVSQTSFHFYPLKIFRNPIMSLLLSTIFPCLTTSRILSAVFMAFRGLMVWLPCHSLFVKELIFSLTVWFQLKTCGSVKPLWSLR